MTDDAARYSKVSRRMWNDQGFRKLSAPEKPNAQHLWFRILTGPELSVIPGCFQAWDAGLARALGWPIPGVQKCFEEIVAQGMAKADWEVGFVFVPKAIKHNKPTSPNIVKGWKKTWLDLPECSLKNEAFQTLKLFLDGVSRGLGSAFRTACPIQEQEQEQDQEQEQEQEDPHTPSGRKRDEQVKQARLVFECWQREHGHANSVFDRKRQARIIARLEEGRSVADLCAALRGAKRDAWLMGKDPKSTKVYDGLETLLRDAEMVERLMKLDVTSKAPAAPPATPRAPQPRHRDPAEDALAARTRERLAAARAAATPEELARAEGDARAITQMAGNLFKPS